MTACEHEYGDYGICIHCSTTQLDVYKDMYNELKTQLDHPEPCAKCVLLEAEIDHIKTRPYYTKVLMLADKMEFLAGEVGRLSAVITGETSKHEWKCTSPGMYDSTYQCTKCGAMFTDQIDAGITMPEDGCTG